MLFTACPCCRPPAEIRFAENGLTEAAAKADWHVKSGLDGGRLICPDCANRFANCAASENSGSWHRAGALENISARELKRFGVCECVRRRIKILDDLSAELPGELPTNEPPEKIAANFVKNMHPKLSALLRGESPPE